MFTGLVREVGRVVSFDGRQARRRVRDERARRGLGLRRRRLPDRHRGRRRRRSPSTSSRRRSRRIEAVRRARQRRAGPARGRSARRPLRPGSRRRRRHGDGRRAGGRGRAPDDRLRRGRLPLLRREGLDRRRRRLADDRGARRRRLRDRARPAHARGDDAAALRPGDQVNLEVDVLAKYVERLLGDTMGR